MLIDPSLEVLLTKADSKFSVVSMVSKRVRQLNAGWEPLIKVGDLKPVGIALKEIAEDKIVMRKDNTPKEANIVETECEKIEESEDSDL
ncbi:DNA-directed RNA polymerase subunit omega [bacterium]|nr:DNA-directed RNA polymerase subunit omega [bacterium]